MPSRLRTVAPLLVATVLALAAVFTVQHAACTDPGRYVSVGDGDYVLVGGCLAPGDIVVPDRAPTPTVGAEVPNRS
ncbi:MAG TPA: hypothetical protein VGE11_17150 [Pseudonocardia sp.]